MHGVARTVEGPCVRALFPCQTSIREQRCREVDEEGGRARVCHLHGEMLPFRHGHVVEKARGIGSDDIAGGTPLAIQSVSIRCVAVDGLCRHDSRCCTGLAQQGGRHVKIKIGESDGDGVVIIGVAKAFTSVTGDIELTQGVIGIGLKDVCSR